MSKYHDSRKAKFKSMPSAPNTCPIETLGGIPLERFLARRVRVKNDGKSWAGAVTTIVSIAGRQVAHKPARHGQNVVCDLRRLEPAWDITPDLKPPAPCVEKVLATIDTHEEPELRLTEDGFAVETTPKQMTPTQLTTLTFTSDVDPAKATELVLQLRSADNEISGHEARLSAARDRRSAVLDQFADAGITFGTTKPAPVTKSARIPKVLRNQVQEETTLALYGAMVIDKKTLSLGAITSRPGYNNADTRDVVVDKLSKRFTKLFGAPVSVALSPNRPYTLKAHT